MLSLRLASPQLPETTPTNVMLAQVLQIRRLLNEPVDLLEDVELIATKVPARQLLLDTAKHL